MYRILNLILQNCLNLITFDIFFRQFDAKERTETTHDPIPSAISSFNFVLFIFYLVLYTW